MKMRSMGVLVVFALLSAAFSFNAEGQQTPLGAKRVVDIVIKGNHAISTPTILNRIKLKPGDIFEESAVNKEIKRLYAMGYFSDVFVETEEKEDGIVVIFTFVEKPTITKIEFRGNAHIRTPHLMKKIKVKQGDLLDFNRLGQDVAAIRTTYTEEGYFKTKVDYKIEKDASGDNAVLVFVIDEGGPLRITKINFEGNKSIKTDELKKLMSLKTAFWFIQKGAYDEDKLDADISRVATYYRSKGFLDAKVSSKMDYSPDGKDIYLTMVVDEGKKYLVGNITVEGALAFPAEDLLKRIKMKSGDAFDYEKMKEDLENIRMFYYDKGYMNAEVDLEHRYDAAADRMNLVYNIQAHEEIYVGMVNIVGNEKTKDKVIRRDIKVYPGEKYDGAKLRRSKERIYNLGYFEDVYFETVPTDTPNVKDLNVTVKETKTGEFTFGGGYSSIDAFLGFVQVRQKNFDLLDFPTFTGAGQDLTIRAELGSARSNYFLSWTDPWIFDYPYLFGFDLYREEHNRFGQSGYGYDETRTGGSLRLGKEIIEDLNSGLIYNLEEVKISNIPDDASEALRKEQGSNWISRATLSFNYDKRDNKYSPSRGYVVDLSLQDAGGWLGADKDFWKTWLAGSYFHSVIEGVVIEVKGAMGVVDNYGKSDEVPIYERYFAGGATTIRGYEERAVGPRDSGSNTALGGEAIVLGTTELTFPIFKNLLKGAVFYDVGNVWADMGDIFTTKSGDTGGYKQGVGIGVRVKTPIGPIKLDYGYPLDKNYDDEKNGQFYFSVSHGF